MVIKKEKRDKIENLKEEKRKKFYRSGDRSRYRIRAKIKHVKPEAANGPHFTKTYIIFKNLKLYIGQLTASVSAVIPLKVYQHDSILV